VKVTGTVTWMFSLFREKTGCGTTLTITYRSPGLASPGSPLPLTLTFPPSLIPAGILTVKFGFISTSLPEMESRKEIVIEA